MEVEPAGLVPFGRVTFGVPNRTLIYTAENEKIVVH